MFLLAKLLQRLIRTGELAVTDATGNVRYFGRPDPTRPSVAIRFTDTWTPARIARHPRLGVGEAFMDGRLVIEKGDIRALLDLVLSNAPWERGAGRKLLNRGAGKWIRRLAEYNQASRARRNVAHHYDIGDRLYDLFLDADRQYSCAYFNDPDETLEEAQLGKKAHIAAKLALKPGQRVLDIGSGWGGMALHLNRVADVDVLGVTLSSEQLAAARARADRAGVADRVKFELIDYRAVAGRFDRIVSVGMFEHVGRPQYETFFAKCRSLLANDGVMLLHTIGRMGGPGTTDAFTAKYVFPGGYNPALSEILAASEKSKMIVADVETLRLHYALTIEHWYARTIAAKERIVAMYDERFYRMWTFYLAGAIAAFRYGGLVNYQVQFIRNRHALPITRSYMRYNEPDMRHAQMDFSLTQQAPVNGYCCDLLRKPLSNTSLPEPTEFELTRKIEEDSEQM